LQLGLIDAVCDTKNNNLNTSRFKTSGSVGNSGWGFLGYTIGNNVNHTITTTVTCVRSKQIVGDVVKSATSSGAK
jgi:hypothetical protein